LLGELDDFRVRHVGQAFFTIPAQLPRWYCLDLRDVRAYVGGKLWFDVIGQRVKRCEIGGVLCR